LRSATRTADNAHNATQRPKSTHYNMNIVQKVKNETSTQRNNEYSQNSSIVRTLQR